MFVFSLGNSAERMLQGVICFLSVFSLIPRVHTRTRTHGRTQTKEEIRNTNGKSVYGERISVVTGKTRKKTRRHLSPYHGLMLYISFPPLSDFGFFGNHQQALSGIILLPSTESQVSWLSRSSCWQFDTV